MGCQIKRKNLDMVERLSRQRTVDGRKSKRGRCDRVWEEPASFVQKSQDIGDDSSYPLVSCEREREYEKRVNHKPLSMYFSYA